MRQKECPQQYTLDLKSEHLETASAQTEAQRTRVFPARLVFYEWRGTTWNINELLELVTSDFERAEVYSKLVFQRRLRAQLLKTGRIDPHEAALKRENPIQGGIAYRIDHYDGPSASARIVKTYVGITQAGENTRLSRHVYQAKRRRGPNSSDESLPAAIRKEFESGVNPLDVFRINVLEHAKTNDELIALEEKWICALNTMAPNGYNIHPPGSLGGPSNSKPIEFEDGGRLHVVANFTEAWHYFRDAYGENRIPEPGTARWRYRRFLENQEGGEGGSEEKEVKNSRKLTIQWVFGVDDAVADGRWGETPCTIDGVFYPSVGAAARATNRKYAAVHSLYHRRLKEARKAGKPEGEPVEIGSSKKPQFRAPALRLPDPRDPNSGALVSASKFHRLTGTNKTSINNRWNALHEDPGRLTKLTGAQIVDILRHGDVPERAKMTVLLPDGTQFYGAKAALAKAFALGGSHARHCIKGFSFSGIKSRLNKVPSPYTNTDLLLALGVVVPPKPLPGPALTRRKRK